MLQFGEEFFLLQRGAAAQQFEERIFPFLFRFNLLLSRLELGEVSDQRFWRDAQIRHSSRTTAQEVNNVLNLSALLRSAGRELNTHSVPRVGYPHHAVGMYFEFRRFQAKVDERTFRKWGVRLDVASAEA